MIQVEHLTFDYPGTRALDDVSFRIAPGSVAALVGPNGAGKTTLLRCLAALDEPLDGSVRIGGVDALEAPRECHRLVGYLSDFFGLYDELTVAQGLRHAAALRGVPAAREAEAVARAAARLGLSDRLDQRAGALSRGLRQRLAIAQSILHEPKVLLLDEPASGLDPESRAALAALFLQLRREGMTLLVSSHILAELDAYSDQMLVLRQGRLTAQTPVAAAAVTAASGRAQLALGLAHPTEGLGALLAAVEGIGEVRLRDGGATFEAPDDPVAQARILRALVEQGIPVRSFGPERRSMQDAYLETVTRSPGVGS